MFSILDEKLRGIISYVFRLLIVIYGLVVVYNSSHNYFLNVGYIFFLSLYYLIFALTKKKSHPDLRLFLDYFIICIILYQKDITFFLNYFLLLIPVLNSSNHSKNKKNYALYIAFTISIVVLGIHSHQLILLIFPLVPILLIDFTLRIRDSIKRLNETLFAIIDAFYAQNIGKKESSKIYNSIITIFSSSAFTRHLKIETILCLVQKRRELLLVNSDKFIQRFEFNNKGEVINALDKEDIIFNRPIIIDEILYNNNVLMKVRGNNRDYIFLLPFSIRVMTHQLRLTLLSRLLLFPFFKHLARVFETQHQIIAQKRKNLYSLQENKEYILKANEVMHFVKNCLSPIKSALRISEMYFNTEDVETKIFLKENFDKQRKQALLEIQNIIIRSDFILEKSKNPFESNNIQEVPVHNVINTVRRIWTEKYSIQDISFSNFTTIEFVNRRCKLDVDTLYLIINNILSNLSKYGGKEHNLNFGIVDNELEVSFNNSINLSKVNIDNLKKDADNYNKNLRIEISKRKSHGFAHLKLYIDSTGAESRIDIENDRFIFKLKLPIH